MPDKPAPPTGEIVLYQTEDGRTRVVECRFVDETLWLSQALIAELFQVTVPTVNEHIKNILDEGEVTGPTIRKFRIVRREGPREVERDIEQYNLDAILAVGYRVRSERGTQFRRWATTLPRQHISVASSMNSLASMT
jgi:hypothetical protein